MKSFGVRLAAGAITILFGAYAAAVAQKDKQSSPGAWTAGPPSLGEPAAPIAGMDDDAWLSQPRPSTDPQPSNFEPGALQLVQHTEEVPTESPSTSGPSLDFSSLPAGLGDSPAPADTPNPIAAVPDWTLEAGAPSENSPQTNAAPEMSLPGGPAAEIAVAEVPEMNLPGSSPASNELPAEQPAGNLPQLELAQSPDMNFYPAENAQSPPPEPAVAETATPGNILRGAEEGLNALRDNSSAAANTINPYQQAPSPAAQPPNAQPQGIATFQTSQPADPVAALSEFTPSAGGFNQPAQLRAPTPNNLAQNSPDFGRSAQQFNQPAVGAEFNRQPGLNGQTIAPQGFNNPVSNSNQLGQPAGRMASLPSNGSYQPQPLNTVGAAVAALPPSAMNAPGDRRLEGIQSPSIVIQKQAPAEVKVGKAAKFLIHVQNVGSVEALDVEVHDTIPSGMRLVDASPAPQMQGNQLLWQLGAMPAGDERTVTMELVPEQEGELGSVARVSFEAAASVRTVSTRPELKINQNAPQTVLIGQQLEIELEVSNPGSGEATNVRLLEDVPEGLSHPKGRKLDSQIGNLAPGEVRRQVLRLRAEKPGMIQNTIHLTSEDGLSAQHSVNIQVVSPDLQVDLTGPSRRFLEREATYQISIANAGTADATNVQLEVQLDRGFTFMSTENQGTYDANTHKVTWQLDRLPAGANGTIGLTLLPVEEGEQAIRMNARADLGVVAKNERRMTVEGFSELNFSIKNSGGPIELGSETTYEIRVTNIGSKPDTNVQLQLRLPQGLQVVSTDGDAVNDQRGNVTFQPRQQLTPGSDFVYTVRVKGVAAGNHIAQAMVISDQHPQPVSKEESTVVYADR
ncbi:MAG: CARDB domain-containing protein [Rubripirellula sp.]